MRLSYNGIRFEFFCGTFDGQQAKKYGFHWDFRRRCWWTTRNDIANKFLAVADEKAKEKLGNHALRIRASKASEPSIDSSLVIPAPPGLDYLPFQKAGISYAMSRDTVLIADDMGLGKTIQACGVINCDPSIKNILVICPAALRINWARELQRWLVRRLSGGFAISQFIDNTNIVITNYDIIFKLRSYLDRRKWDLLIADEAHMLKNPFTRRTIAVLGEDKRTPDVYPIQSRRKIFLTGTPILNRPAELWPMVRAADPEGLGMDRAVYMERYCAAFDSPWGYDTSGAANLEELNERLRSTFMIRRKKEDVLKDLPKKRRQIVLLPPEENIGAIRAELEFYEKHQRAVEEAHKEAETSQSIGDAASYQRAANCMRSEKKVLFEEMAKLRHETAVAKIPYIISHLKNVLLQEEKAVFFAHHHDVIDAIQQHFGTQCVRFDGRNPNDRQRSIDRFVQDKSCRLFNGSISAAGIGIDGLQKVSCYALFGEMDWRPAMLTQAEDRLFRIGQKFPVLIQHLVFDDSLDAKMVVDTIKKQEIIAQAVD